jgi:mRNA-degrading endonuclease RelE of RelBE toxin-antitoxin system
MSWKVTATSKTQKQLKKLPSNIKELFQQLALDIEDTGPIRGDWPNYSKLANGGHHCHLNYNYVAVWFVVANQIKFVEVTYVGSRENAPY